ncbi:MAG: hypothetical protein WBG45_04770 [Paenisporosarcina sp.]
MYHSSKGIYKINSSKREMHEFKREVEPTWLKNPSSGRKDV